MSKKKQKLILLGLLTLACIIVAFALKRVSQSVEYHHFADARQFLGVTNFANVISNIPFLVGGIIGMVLLSRTKASKSISVIYLFLFIGVLFTGVGSAYYHLSTNNNTLVYDRIPMTIVFMSFLAATISERINEKWGVVLLLPLVAIGIGSVLYWHLTELKGMGDLRLYGLVQFYPVLFIPLVLVLFPSQQKNAGLSELAWIVVWYVIAKLFEHFDWQIYSLGNLISGHTLKHLAAAMSCWYLVKLFRRKYIVVGSKTL